MLKIISWNIQQGGGTRIYPIVEKLVSDNYGIIVLSEYKNNSNGLKISEILRKNGFGYQTINQADSNENSVFIASKFDSTSIIYPNADPVFYSNIITSKFSAFNLMGVYLPHKKKHNLFPFITNEISNSSVPFIVVGDYNVGHNFIDQKGDSFWYQTELRAFENAGMVDAFRYIHKNTEEYSWFSHQGNGFRYDHSYVHKSILPIVKNCYYIHEWRQSKLSDHSPMVLELG